MNSFKTLKSIQLVLASVVGVAISQPIGGIGSPFGPGGIDPSLSSVAAGVVNGIGTSLGNQLWSGVQSLAHPNLYGNSLGLNGFNPSLYPQSPSPSAASILASAGLMNAPSPASSGQFYTSQFGNLGGVGMGGNPLLTNAALNAAANGWNPAATPNSINLNTFNSPNFGATPPNAINQFGALDLNGAAPGGYIPSSNPIVNYNLQAAAQAAAVPRPDIVPLTNSVPTSALNIPSFNLNQLQMQNAMPQTITPQMQPAMNNPMLSGFNPRR